LSLIAAIFVESQSLIGRRELPEDGVQDALHRSTGSAAKPQPKEIGG
jgi:hypothetical protein